MQFNRYAGKTTPVNSDTVLIYDSENRVNKQVTVSNLAKTLSLNQDEVRQALAEAIAAGTIDNYVMELTDDGNGNVTMDI